MVGEMSLPETRNSRNQQLIDERGSKGRLQAGQGRLTHEFVVGGRYANRRGDYEVIAIDEANDRMTLSYIQGGERQTCDLSGQTRIWGNMQREHTVQASLSAQEALREARKKPARKATAKDAATTPASTE